MDIGQIQDVTDSLALMPDATLQKYAMMNKDDPYIMSLAMSENNRRQKLRTAQQGQAGQMPAPKVVDQAIQSINPPPAPPPQAMPPQQAMPQAQTQLPEDQGIAQLPAPNMQGMADGGIAGYADRGLVRGQNESFEDYRQRVLKSGQIPGVESPYYTKSTDDRDELIRQANTELERRRAANQIPVKSPYVTDTADLTKAPPPAVKPAPTVKPAALSSTAADQGRGKSGGPSEKELIAAGIAAAPPQKKASGAGAEAGAGAGIGAAPTSGASVNTGGGLPTLVTSPATATTPATTPADAAAELSAIKASQKPEVPAEIRSALEDAGAARRTSLDAEEAQRQQDLASMGTAFSDREARLKAKQGRVDQQEKDLKPMAIMQAGFAMMSGTSPHALSNIGAGATIGLKTYQEGLEKIEIAKDKLDDAFGRIEEFRRSESMMNAKDKRKYVRELSDTFADTKKALVDVYVKDWGVKQDDARTIYSALVADRREAANRAFQAGESAAQRSFLGGENAAQRSFTAGENAANRASTLQNTKLQASLQYRPDPMAREREIGTNPTGAVARGYAAMREDNIAPTLFAQWEKLAGDPTINTGATGNKYFTKGDEFKAANPTPQGYIAKYRDAMRADTMPQAGGSGFTIVGSRPAK